LRDKAECEAESVKYYVCVCVILIIQHKYHIFSAPPYFFALSHKWHNKIYIYIYGT